MHHALPRRLVNEKSRKVHLDAFLCAFCATNGNFDRLFSVKYG